MKLLLEIARKTECLIDIDVFLAEWQQEWEDWLAEDPDQEEPTDIDKEDFFMEMLHANGPDLLHVLDSEKWASDFDYDVTFDTWKR